MAFNDSVTASAPLLYLNGSRFNGVAHLTNNGSSSVTSTGGCYFKKKASIYNSCSTSITYSFSTTAIDTFVTDALIQNNIGTLAFTKAVFLGAVTLKMQIRQQAVIGIMYLVLVKQYLRELSQ
ncbi:MAG: hypothetical protein IPN88_03325 [Bacteroidetes bacterium]|nr:hypothetical protein [Bacteroidota bacterium]